MIDRCTPAGEGNEGNASHSHTVDLLANQTRRTSQLQSSHSNSSSMLVVDVLSTLAAVCHGGPAGEVRLHFFYHQ